MQLVERGDENQPRKYSRCVDDRKICFGRSNGTFGVEI